MDKLLSREDFETQEDYISYLMQMDLAGHPEAFTQLVFESAEKSKRRKAMKEAIDE